MAWEFVLVNEDGINRWKLRPKQEAEEECSTTAHFSIENVKVSGPTTKVNFLRSSNEIFPVGKITEDRSPVPIVGLASNNNTAISGAPGVGQSAIHLDSDSSIIFTDYVNNNTSLTISFWVYPTSVSGNDRFLFGSKISGGNNCWSILRDGSSWRCIWDQNNTQSSSALATVDVDEWQHIAVSWHLDGLSTGYLKFYKNGILEGDQHGVSDGNSGEWTIGGRSDDGSSIVGHRFQGFLSSISFHESVLSDVEILELAKADHNQDLSSDFGDYTSSATLALAILGGTGNYLLMEDYPDSYTESDSVYVQSDINYGLDVTTNTTGGTPHVEVGGISYLNKFPEPVSD